MDAKRFLIVLLAIFFLMPNSGHAKTFNSVVVYGDSLSDNGNFFKATGQPGFPYYEGRRSDGPVAVEYLASSLGAPLIDFAWIGATTGVGNYADGGTVTGLGAYNLPGMTTVYGLTKGLLGPFMSGGLFVVWGGPNDILAPSPLDTNILEITSRAVANELAIIDDLKGMGAKTILAPGMPDLGLTPYFNSISPAYAALGTLITNVFNDQLKANLPSDVIYYDTAALMRSVVSNPAAYGFTNVTDACFNGSKLVCDNPGTYLFFDDFHPTTATHELLAKGFEAAVVPLPSAILLFFTGFGFIAALRRWLSR